MLATKCRQQLKFFGGDPCYTLKEQKVAPDESLVSFDVSALVPTIPVPMNLQVKTGNLQNI